MLPFLFILLHLSHFRLLLPTLSFVPLPMALPCARLSFLSFIVISIGQRAGLGVPFHQYTSPSFGHSVFLYHEAVHIPSIFFQFHLISNTNQSFISVLTISSIRQTTPIKLARPATYRTALPHFPAISTIFYILYPISPITPSFAF